MVSKESNNTNASIQHYIKIKKKKNINWFGEIIDNKICIVIMIMDNNWYELVIYKKMLVMKNNN